jgi:hypothetical protein
VKCLAPPPGEYEVHLKTPSGAILVVNEDGFFLRRFSVEESLPFMVSHDRLVGFEELDKLAGLEEVLCAAVKALREASTHGSIKALRKIRSCSKLIERIEEGCAKKGKRL